MSSEERPPALKSRPPSWVKAVAGLGVYALVLGGSAVSGLSSRHSDAIRLPDVRTRTQAMAALRDYCGSPQQADAFLKEIQRHLHTCQQEIRREPGNADNAFEAHYSLYQNAFQAVHAHVRPSTEEESKVAGWVHRFYLGPDARAYADAIRNPRAYQLFELLHTGGLRFVLPDYPHIDARFAGMRPTKINFKHLDAKYERIMKQHEADAKAFEKAHPPQKTRSVRNAGVEHAVLAQLIVDQEVVDGQIRPWDAVEKTDAVRQRLDRVRERYAGKLRWIGVKRTEADVSHNVRTIMKGYGIRERDDLDYLQARYHERMGWPVSRNPAREPRRLPRPSTPRYMGLASTSRRRNRPRGG